MERRAFFGHSPSWRRFWRMPFYGCQTLKASSLPPSQLLSFEELLKREDALNPIRIYPLSRLISRLVRENSCQWLVKNVSPLVRNDRLVGKEAKEESEQLNSLILHLLSLALEMIAAAEMAAEDIYYIFAIKQMMISVRHIRRNSRFPVSRRPEALHSSVLIFVVSYLLFYTCSRSDADGRPRCDSVFQAMPLIERIDNKKLRTELQELNGCVWEIHSAVSSRSSHSTAAEGHLESSSSSSSSSSPKEENSAPIKNCLTWLLWGQAFIKLSRSYYVPQGAVGRTEFLQCLDFAINKFQQSQSLANEALKLPTLTSDTKPLLQAVLTDALCGIAYAHLQKGRHTSDTSLRHKMFVDAKKVFNKAESIRPSQNSTYNLACIASLLDDEYECKQWLVLCARDGTLPRSKYLQSDPDLGNVRTKSWFLDLLRHGSHAIPSQDLDSAKWNTSFQQLSVVLPPISLSIPVNADPSPSKEPGSHGAGVPAVSSGEVQYGSADADLNAAMNYDEELNRLQASLLRDGLSKSTVANMIYEVSKGKKQYEVDTARIKAAKERLDGRMKTYGMKEKSIIPADGNCQFHSISDQLFDSTQRSGFIRRKVTDWLQSHADWELPNGAKMRDFVHDKTWEEYCKEMARDGIWGDHLTLTAAAEIFGTRICIISSVEGDHFLTEIHPVHRKSDKILFLSHYAEYHYSSLCKA